MKKRKKYILIAASWFTVLLCWQFFSLYIGNKDIFPSAFQLITAVFYLFSEASFLSAGYCFPFVWLRYWHGALPDRMRFAPISILF